MWLKNALFLQSLDYLISKLVEVDQKFYIKYDVILSWFADFAKQSIKHFFLKYT